MLSSSSSSSKSFFKVILCSILRDHKLRVPDEFSKRYGNELSDLVRIMDPAGGIWCVGVQKTDETIWLHEGLHKFLEDHSIRVGYFLIFKYKENSTFKVHIFDLSAFEIEYPINRDSASPDNVNQLPISDQEEDNDGRDEKTSDEGDDDSSIEILGSFMDHPQSSEIASGNKQSSGLSVNRWKPSRCYLTRSKKRKVQDDGRIETTRIHPPRRNMVCRSNKSTHKATAALVSSSKANRGITSRKRLVEVQTNRAIRSANMSLPKNRSYEMTLKPFHIQKNIVNMPAEFARLYLSYKSQIIKLLDADDNEWEVHCLYEKNRGCKLSKGWAKYRVEKDLKVGDVCVFQPIRINDEVKIKVKTSRDAI